MSNSATALDEYKFSRKDIFLFDANIWLYLFPAPSSSSFHLTKSYSSAFKNILSTGCTVVINALILSEYLNRYCRLEWSALHKVQFPDYKLFRQSAEYAAVGQAAAGFAGNILKLCKKGDDCFSIADMGKILGGFENGTVDFNDGMIVDACMRHTWTLVTHDGDFTRGDISVLTCNRRLLKACSP